jgi:RimJ/RimL family protein N-acetyltransferase
VIHWSAHAGNPASWRVAHACGFTFRAELPLSIEQHGELRDGWFAVLRPDDDPYPRTTWWPTPVLDGVRVRLRRPAERDMPRIVEACTDPRTRHWLPHLPHPHTDETARRFVRDSRLGARGQGGNWSIADIDDDRLLGNIAVFGLAKSLSPTAGEPGYWSTPTRVAAG